ncbi:MAG: hypothetical protein ACYC4L_03640 [Chloroflexota bacterium]
MQQLQTMHPLHLVVWAGIEEVIKDARLAGLIALGRAIATALPGESLEEKLEVFDGGAENREVLTRREINGRLVRVKRDVFTSDCCGLPWSRHTAALLDRYNTEVPRGGAAVHPLHIVLHEVHRGLGQIVDIATRNPIGGFLVFSPYGLQRAGLSESQAEEIMGDSAILYAILD